MLISPRRIRCLFFVLIFALFLVFIYRKKYVFTDEHRIYTSLIVELPHFERLIREKQTNLSDTQNRLIKIERTLSKYTWHLNRLIQTINYNKQEIKRISHFNSFDFDLEKNQSKFLVYFHFITNISNDINHEILKQFHSNIQSPYLTLNETEAFLKIIYLPIRSNQAKICYKDLFNKNYFIIYEFTNQIHEQIDERCFQGNFLPVKFFHQQRFVINDYWRFNEQERASIGIVYLNTNCEFWIIVLINRQEFIF